MPRRTYRITDKFYHPGEDKIAYERRQKIARERFGDQMPEPDMRQPISAEAYRFQRDDEFLPEDYDKDDLPTVRKVLYKIAPSEGKVSLESDEDGNSYVILTMPASELVGENPTTDQALPNANERTYVHKLDGDDPLLASINQMNREANTVSGSADPPKDRTTLPQIGDEAVPVPLDPDLFEIAKNMPPHMVKQIYDLQKQRDRNSFGSDESMPNISSNLSSSKAPKTNITRDTFTRYQPGTEASRLRAQNDANRRFYSRIER
jgi:hypothetical protein